MAAALWLADGAASADTITLTNGRVIEADRTWYEGTQLRYEKNGGVFGLPKSLVQSIDQRAAGATQSPEVAQARERLLSGDPAGAVRLLRGVLAKDTHERTIRLAPPLVIDRSDREWALGQVVDVLSTPVG